MFRKVFLGSVICLLAALAVAQMKTVTLKDGRKITGEVTKTDDGYQIKRKYGVVVVSKDQVVSIEDVTTPQEQYRQRLAKIDRKSPQDHYELGRWAFRTGLLEIARNELEAALKLKGDYERAKLLLRRVEARIEADSKKTPKTVATGPTTGPAGPVTGKVVLRPEWLVGQEDIYRIRLEELRENDKATIVFRNDVIKRFIKMMRGVGDFRDRGFEKRFQAASRLDKVRYIRQNVDRDNSEIKDDIIIKSDPAFMMDFRTKIWPTVARYCATAACHGGTKPRGGFKLFNVAGKNEKIDYTNFLILDGFTTKQGRRMIDRNNREESLLLQCGLPEELAKFKHPHKITTPYADRKSANYVRVLQWIRSLEGGLHPSYRVKYTPPFGMKLNFGGSSVLDIPEPEPATRPTTDKTDVLSE